MTGDGFQFVGAAREGRQNLVDLRAEFTDGSVDMTAEERETLYTTAVKIAAAALLA